MQDMTKVFCYLIIGMHLCIICSTAMPTATRFYYWLGHCIELFNDVDVQICVGVYTSLCNGKEV